MRWFSAVLEALAFTIHDTFFLKSRRACLLNITAGIQLLAVPHGFGRPDWHLSGCTGHSSTPTQVNGCMLHEC